MSSREREQKYVYKFTLPARKAEFGAPEPSKAEIQAYINEVLGIKKEKGTEQS